MPRRKTSLTVPVIAVTTSCDDGHDWLPNSTKDADAWVGHWSEDLGRISHYTRTCRRCGHTETRAGDRDA